MTNLKKINKKMKLTISELKIFIFCLLNTLAFHIGVAQSTPSMDLAVQDSLQVIENDEILKTPFGTFNLSQTTGVVFRVSGDELRKTAGNSLAEALKGRVPGLRVTKTSNNPASPSYAIFLNGQVPYVLVDGQPRGLQVDLREVEEVLVLNDGTFNSILGPLGANGLIYVITRGAKPSKLVVEVDYQRAINMSTRMPDLLSASEYATVINQASNNDGFGDIYSVEAIEAYKTGSDPIKYPNVDYQNTFLNKLSTSNFASLSLYGGNESVSYSAFVGYSDWQGLEKIGKQIDGRDLSFRTKIKTRINNVITTHASIYGKMSENDRAVASLNSLSSWISSTPANAFPLKAQDTAYVVSREFTNNVLSELEAGGERTDFTSNLVFDIGVDFDFNKYIPGLKYDTYVMMRTYNSQTLTLNHQPATYTMNYLEDSVGQDSLALNQYSRGIIDYTKGRSALGLARNFTYGGNLSYNKKTTNGVLNLNLNHLLYYEPSRAGASLDRRFLTSNLNSSYALQKKYVMFANLNMSSSSKYINEYQTKLFPTVGLAWIASNEKFLKDSKIVDFIKFRTSYGQIGTEYNAFTYIQNDTWTGSISGGNPYFGNATTVNENYLSAQFSTGNVDFDWIVSNQLFIGVDMKLLKKINLNFNYFDIETKGIGTLAPELYADALGDNAFLPGINFESTRNRGFNSNITYSETKKEFKYYVGFNAGYNKIIEEKSSEIPYPDQYRLQQGQRVNRIMGYVSDGLFTAENIADALPQFGEVQIGDVKYLDQNGDNVIDDRDRREIGNSDPSFNYGINIGFAYKGFNFDAVGSGVAGYDLNLANYNYYRHNGLGTYYGSVNNDLPNGNENPRLSTLTSVNNYQTSDYWTVDASYFRISNVELGYTFPTSMLSNIQLTNVKLFVRGSNLALFSKLKDIDPENTNAGFTDYSMMRSFVLGATLNF